MKRMLVILCMACYMANAIDLSFSLNVCEEALCGMGIYNEGDCCCGDDAGDDCCSTSSVQVSNTEDHYRISAKTIEETVSEQIVPQILKFDFPRNITWISTDHRSNADHYPRVSLSKLPLYIFHLVFRI